MLSVISSGENYMYSQQWHSSPLHQVRLQNTSRACALRDHMTFVLASPPSARTQLRLKLHHAAPATQVQGRSGFLRQVQECTRMQDLRDRL